METYSLGIRARISLGDVVKQENTQDSKSCALNRLVGSSPTVPTNSITVWYDNWFRRIEMLPNWHVMVMGCVAYIYHYGCNCESGYNVVPNGPKICFKCNTEIPKDLDVVITLTGSHYVR